MNNEFKNGEILYAQELNELREEVKTATNKVISIDVGRGEFDNMRPGSLIGGSGALKNTTSANRNKTYENNSLAFGLGLITNCDGEIAFGQYNDSTIDNEDSAKLIFSIGNGENSSNRSNLLALYTNGNIQVKQTINYKQNDEDISETKLWPLATEKFVELKIEELLTGKKFIEVETKTINNENSIKGLQDLVGGTTLPEGDTTKAHEIRIKNLEDLSLNFDKKIPINGIYITSSNLTAEEVSEVLGYGTWQLIDKEFRPESITEEVGQGGALFTPNGDVFWSYTEIIDGVPKFHPGYELKVLRAGHTIRIRLDFIPRERWTVEATNNTFQKVGEFSLSALGVEENKNLWYSIIDYPVGSDGANGLILMTLALTGELSVTDIIKGFEANRSKFHLNLEITLKPDHMSNSYCNKFYWQRIEDSEEKNNDEENQNNLEGGTT